MEKTLQQKMLEYRAREDISQAELAKRCNLTTPTVAMVERGLQEPSKLTESKILLVVDNKENK